MFSENSIASGETRTRLRYPKVMMPVSQFQWLPMALPSIAFTCCPHEIWIGVNFLHAQLWLSRTVAACLSLQIDRTLFVESHCRDGWFSFVPHLLSAVGAGCLMLQGIEEQEVWTLGLKKVFYSGTHSACNIKLHDFVSRFKEHTHRSELLGNYFQ
jgi:hypothetical protein